jgi:hypothetical protein
LTAGVALLFEKISLMKSFPFTAEMVSKRLSGTGFVSSFLQPVVVLTNKNKSIMLIENSITFFIELIF